MNKIFVTTSPKYIEVLKVWLHLCNKFWHPAPKIIILGNGKCTINLPENATFVNVGNDPNKDLWSENMGRYFASIDDEYIAMIMEDCWITAPVNVKDFEAIETEAQRLDIDRTYFTRSFASLPKLRPHCRDSIKVWGKQSDLLFAKDPQANYLISLHGSFWNRKKLVELCSQFPTPWAMEEEGTIYARQTGWKTGIPVGIAPIEITEVTLKFRDPGGPDHLWVSMMSDKTKSMLAREDPALLKYWRTIGTMDIPLNDSGI